MVRWELGKGHGAQAEPLSTRRLLATGPLAASSDGAGGDDIYCCTPTKSIP